MASSPANAKALWQQGYGILTHSSETQKRIEQLAEELVGLDAKMLYQLLAAADRVTCAALWLTVHQTYAKNIYTDGRELQAEDFKKDPQGHLGGALNMVPAYVGYMLANAISSYTRGWVMEQGHAVSAIDAVNLLLGNLLPVHSKRYSVTDKGLSLFAQDFYAYRLNEEGKQESPLGSHVNPNTAGGFLEGGYLGFASLQYVHMPLPGERLVAFLSDGASEEQKGADWTARWWRAEDCGLVAPIMIANGRRIDQRTTMDQEGGAPWFAKYLELHDFDPIIFDGRDPAAFAWCILEQEKRLRQNVAGLQSVNRYRIRIPYGIAVAPKGAGFYNEGTNYAHNLPLVTNPSKDKVAAQRFNIHVQKLFVPQEEVTKAVECLNNHAKSGRVREKDHPMAGRDVAACKSPQWQWAKTGATSLHSPMDAIDEGFIETVRENPQLRPRVGNPDEMLSNKMDNTLEELSFRVREAEGGLHESTLGNVITALNEEAVSAAAFGNKGGINIVVTYEAFGSKMFGQARQEVIFSKHQKDLKRPAKWLSVPIILTSNTWENSKNELSHQDPSMAESMLGEHSDISRVVFPGDYNTALATMDQVYKTHGQIWTTVVPKLAMTSVFSGKEALAQVKDGGSRVSKAGFQADKADIVLVAVGAYQLQQALKASERLKEHQVPHCVSYLYEPGRFRMPRNEGEAMHLATSAMAHAVIPKSAKHVVLMTHTRPEVVVGMLAGTLFSGRTIRALGFINQGGTLNVPGMLFVNRCSWVHAVEAVAGLVGKGGSKLLTEAEKKVLDGKKSPEGVVL